MVQFTGYKENVVTRAGRMRSDFGTKSGKSLDMIIGDPKFKPVRPGKTMKALLKILFLLIFAGITFSACEKKASEIVVPEEKGPKWGYIDHSGKFVIKPKFRRVKSFHEGLAAADLHARWGFIDKEGNFKIPRQYEDVKDFAGGYAGVQLGGKWGVVDKNGELVVPCEHLDIGVAHEVNPDAEDHAVLMPYMSKDDNLWGFKDFGPHGQGDIAPQWSQVKYFNDGLCPVQDPKSGKWGYINNKGEVVIPYKFDTASVFQDRVAETMMGDDFLWVDQIGTMAEKSRLQSNQLFSEGVALQQRKGKFVFINRKGKRAFRKKFRYADNFSEGLAVVQPLRSIKRGFIDTRGHLVIDAIYDDARGFSDQVAAVRVDPDEFFKIYNENGTPKDGSKRKADESDEDGEDRDEDGEKIEPKDGEGADENANGSETEEATKSDTDSEKSEKPDKSEISNKTDKGADSGKAEKSDKSEKSEKPAKSEKANKE